MSGGLPAGSRIRPGAFSAWVDRVLGAVMVLGLGVLLGFEYMTPDKRVLSVLAGLVVAGIAWRLEIVAGIGVMILALPFPKGTTFGTTNLALILLVLVIYLLRVGQREVARPAPTPIDMPLLGLCIAYLVSFYNVTPENMQGAFANTELFVGTILMFGVVVNSVRSEADLKRLHGFQMVTLGLVLVIALWELTHPGKALVPGWLDFTQTTGEAFNTRNVRIGGAFHDYELLADYCGLNIIFLAFLVSRARDTSQRILYGTLMAGTVFVLFSTVTRGPIVSLAVALAYMMWLMRRRLRVVPVTIGAAAITAVFLGTNFIVSRFTRSGDLFVRLSQTEIKGFVPDTREAAWKDAWDHFLLHPLIGSGPLYSTVRGLHSWFWPHDLYMYVENIVGILGLAFFLWMLWTLFSLTKPNVDTPAAESYLESYLFIARVQCVFFLVDQIKIEYLRNDTYQYQAWLMFALWVTAARLRANGPPAPLRATRA